TVELGCGLALPSFAAALAGGRVLATDWSPAAIELARANAERNDIELELAVCSWAQPDALLTRAPWDLVLGADLLYEQRNGDLHAAPELLVLVNAWDAASARTIAAAEGCRALATASWAIAAAHGVSDGDLERDAMLAAVARIAGAVDVPVTADLEAGYGGTAA